MSLPLKSNLRSVMFESIRSGVVAIVISLEKPANTLLCWLRAEIRTEKVTASICHEGDWMVT